jgi:hypothetical protein
MVSAAFTFAPKLFFAWINATISALKSTVSPEGVPIAAMREAVRSRLAEALSIPCRGVWKSIISDISEIRLTSRAKRGKLRLKRPDSCEPRNLSIKAIS